MTQLRYILLFAFIAIASLVQAQVRISGTVYEMNKVFPLGSVSVLSTSGRGTVTDSMGRYSIVVPEDDSIYFSYLGRPTPKYAVSTIPQYSQFDISLHVNVTMPRFLTIRNPDSHSPRPVRLRVISAWDSISTS
jgi:hypothetical protein